MTTEKLNIVVRRGLWCLVAAYVLLHSTLSSPSPFMRALIPETKAFGADATTHEMQLLRRHDGGLYAYVVADDRCVVPSDSLRALGYDEKDADTVRVGVHRVGVRLFVLPDSLISR